ncbi:CBS domain-containing protein [Paraburkholderia sp. DHOC27]|uniref:CBS domain-containing protein n=1 Tax=Paraburkholderia sp. DHOC27 TaxID=2303330 RepID=UPI000E3CBC53|nr:CBS domain-containing protein [Paraburkholderia sp. DHOC27]RFU45278.1 CBS domain-containing protein [Paraburkholderia sp. DHOC27]
MHHVYEIMSRDLLEVAPTDTLRHAAELMRRYDVAALPVCQNQRLVGMVTRHDLTARTRSASKAQDARVHEVACASVNWCFDDDDLDSVQRRMARSSLSQMPVVDRDRKLVGALSLDALPVRTDHAAHDDVAHTLEGVSQPQLH